MGIRQEHAAMSDPFIPEEEKLGSHWTPNWRELPIYNPERDNPQTPVREGSMAAYTLPSLGSTSHKK